ncbi:MAG: hypothetical protein ICV60_00470 [Pyrinomonadaceae bacterium]|nr:hypothetical protein [Pyrinomonadaceae bacterium]
METHDRRTFLKRSAMLAAVAASGRLLTSSASGKGNITSQQGFNRPFFSNARHPDVIAHRGGDGERPGETMMAMQGAFRLNVDVLEMDVYMTKDGHLVLMHDILVSKTTEVDGPIKRFFPVNKFTLSELQQLNAGYRWPKHGPRDESFYGKKFNELAEDKKLSLRVPTLREVFDAFPQTRMNIEMKPAFVSPAEALSQLIREKNMRDNVLVASFWHPYLKDFRQLSPEVATSASAMELISYIHKHKRPNADAIQVLPQIHAELKKQEIIQWSIITEKFLKKAHDDNLPVHAWTINDEQEMKRIKDLGIDGIITDYPKRLLSILGRPVPA